LASRLLIVVDPNSGVPVYRQLMDQIKFHVASGVLCAGDELPSTRALSAELGVNPMTVSKAYSYLEKEDVVERRPGRPLVVRAATGEAGLHERKRAQLRESLIPTVTMIRQLGLPVDEALDILRDLLTRPPDEPAASAPSREDDA
jgi:GntR family transcriptional regulator